MQSEDVEVKVDPSRAVFVIPSHEIALDNHFLEVEVANDVELWRMEVGSAHGECMIFGAEVPPSSTEDLSRNLNNPVMSKKHSPKKKQQSPSKSCNSFWAKGSLAARNWASGTKTETGRKNGGKKQQFVTSGMLEVATAAAAATSAKELGRILPSVGKGSSLSLDMIGLLANDRHDSWTSPLICEEMVTFEDESDYDFESSSMESFAGFFEEDKTT